MEYKRDLNFGSDAEKKELARDVSSFANADGGDLVFGANKAKDESGKKLGYPDAIMGIGCPNFEELRMRLESFLRGSSDPLIPGVEICQVEGFDRGPVLIYPTARPRQASRPHRSSFVLWSDCFGYCANAGREIASPNVRSWHV